MRGDAGGFQGPSSVPKSSVPGLAWPALPGGQGAAILALLGQLERSQWWSPEQLRARQLEQAALLLSHAVATVPFYRDRLAAIGFDSERGLTAEHWSRLPLLSRTDIQEAGDALLSTQVPQQHGRIYRLSTSGSPARPWSGARTSGPRSATWRGGSPNIRRSR